VSSPALFLSCLQVAFALGLLTVYFAFNRTKRIVEYLKKYRPNQADIEPLHSVYAISDLIKKAARSLYVWSEITVKTYQPVFSGVITELAHSITSPAASAGQNDTQ
jgi:hypothetical protein